MSKQIPWNRQLPPTSFAGSRGFGDPNPDVQINSVKPGPLVRRTCVLALIGGLLLAALAFATVGIAQRPATATNAARNAALTTATEGVLKETSEIRQLPILRPVQSRALTRSEIEQSVIKNLDEDLTPAEVHANEVAVRKLGLAPRDFQYRPLMVKLLTEQIAGYYDPRTRNFYLADWIDLDGQKPIMAHELTHALQDQNFDLRRFEHWPKGDSDAELSAHALIEGDATLAMMLYVANNPMRALAFVKSLGASHVPTEELDKAPRVFRETLLFPYQEGLAWTRAVYKRDGWKGVSRAFTDLPQSSEQILHPEKYFAHEAPIKLTLPDISALLNGSNSPVTLRSSRRRFTNASLNAHRPASVGVAGAWKRIDQDVQGELGFYLILDQFLNDQTESRRAAAGWGGDRFNLYEDSKGNSLFVSESEWDAENDAVEFADAYLKRTLLRYPGALTKSLDDIRIGVSYHAFATDEGNVVMGRRGSRVLIVEGIPASVDTRALLKALWN